MLRYRAQRLRADGVFDLLVVGLTRADVAAMLLGAPKVVQITGEPPDGFGVPAPSEVTMILWADPDDEHLARRFAALQEALGS